MGGCATGINERRPRMEDEAARIDAFVAQHAPQLRSVPEALWRSIARQVLGEQFTAGEHVEFSRLVVAGEGQDSAEGAQTFAIAKGALAAGSVAFLVDHAWTFESLGESLQALCCAPGLLPRLSEIAVTSASAAPAAPATAETGTETEAEAGGEGGGLPTAFSLLQLLERLVPLFGSYSVATGPASGGVVPTRDFIFLPDEVGCYTGRAPDRAADPATPSAATAAAVNLGTSPLLNMRTGQAFTVAWPLTDIPEGAHLVCGTAAHETQVVRRVLGLHARGKEASEKSAHRSDIFRAE